MFDTPFALASFVVLLALSCFTAVYVFFLMRFARESEVKLDALCKRLGVDPKTGKIDFQPPIQP